MKNFSIFILILVLGVACSTRYSFSGGSVPAEAKTFSVSYVTVRASLADPNYGQQVTEGLKDLLNTQTRLSLSNEEGDIHYEGEVSKYDIQPVAASGDEIATRNRLTVNLKIRFFNRLEPEKDKEITVSQFEDFEASDNFDSVEEALLESINPRILQEIYDKTLGDW